MEILMFLIGFFVGILCVLIIIKIISKNNDSIKEQIELQFENIATKILKDGSDELSEKNKEKLEEFLLRFKDKIDEFEKRSSENLRTEIEKFDIFDVNIKSFLDAGKTISENTNSLISVMRADNRTSGRWGEIVLERVLELSGLRKDEEYQIQKSIKEGRPDATIILPDNRYVYIDSKTSFQAWDGYINAKNDDEKAEYKKLFTESTKKHITGLAKRDYSNESNTPDYVLMFIPIESCYSMMFCDDCELWNYAWENNIMPVSPSTLLASLKIINSFYIADRQNKNVIEMARLCTSVHDKFAALLTDLIKIKDNLNTTLKKLTGNGNIITQISKLEKLGCKFEKDIPALSEEIGEIDENIN